MPAGATRPESGGTPENAPKLCGVAAGTRAPWAKKSPVNTHGTFQTSKVPYSQAGVRRKPHGLPESGGTPENDPKPCGVPQGPEPRGREVVILRGI